MNKAEREDVLQAMTDGKLEVDGPLPVPLYPKGWVSRAEMCDQAVWKRNKLVALVARLEGLTIDAAEKRVQAMVQDGTLRKLDDDRYEVVPTSEATA